MKKAVITGERQVGLVDVPMPEPKEDWALVKVHAIPMCTEYKGYQAGHQNAFLGHEAVGEVVAVDQPCQVAVGDRVVALWGYPCGACELCAAGEFLHCQNWTDLEAFTGSPEGSATYAQYILKPAWLLAPIPDEVSYEDASLTLCALGPTFGALQTMKAGAFDTVLITGLGPVGLGGVINARFRGARVIGVESIPWRMERAREMGAAAVLDPRDPDILAQLRDLTGGKGVDYAVDCSGNVLAERLCIDATRRKGMVGFVGECSDDLQIKISPDMIRTGLMLFGSWGYNLADYPRVMQVVRESPLLDLLVSHRMGLSEVQEAFELQATGQCAKVILDPWH